MKPSTIRTIGFKLIGGNGNGTLVAHFPKTLQEVADAFKEAKDFLMNSDTEWIQVQMLNKEGQKELRSLYKQQKEVEKPTAPMFNVDDPFAWAHYA